MIHYFISTVALIVYTICLAFIYAACEYVNQIHNDKGWKKKLKFRPDPLAAVYCLPVQSSFERPFTFYI